MAFQVDLAAGPESFRGRKQGGAAFAAAMPAEPLSEQYGLLEEAILQAGCDHIITPLPASEPGSAKEYSHSRLRTIRNRLFLLGYLEADNGRATLGPMLKTAVAAFQGEAKLGDEAVVVDGWIGEQSWGALQELVSFEEPSNLQRWLIRGKLSPVLMRATHLRLYALGLAAEKPSLNADSAPVIAGLSNFSEVAGLLKLADGKVEPEPLIATLKLLFDQDELVRRLALSSAPRSYEEKLKVKPFIINMAKVELWLHGYDIQPDGYSEGMLCNSAGRELDLKKSKLRKILTQYWCESGMAASTAELKAMMLIKTSFPEFFAKLQGDSRDQDQLPDSQLLFRQIEASVQQDRDLLQKVWDHVYSIGSRIWDGIKRAWRLFRSMVKRAASAAGAFLNNISRLAYHYILKSYEAIKAVIRGVSESIRFFAAPVMRFPKAEGVFSRTVMIHDRDLDFSVLVDQRDDPSVLEHVATFMDGKSSLFGISCRFLAELLDVLVGMLKRSLFTGWAALLMALLKIYQSIARWAPEFMQAQQA